MNSTTPRSTKPPSTTPPSTPNTPHATTPHATTPIHGSQQILDAAAAYNQALAALETLILASPSIEAQQSKACEASLCAAGGGAAQASRAGLDCWKSFSKRLSAGKYPTPRPPRPQKRRWSEVVQLASADASPAPSAPSTRDANSRN